MNDKRVASLPLPQGSRRPLFRCLGASLGLYLALTLTGACGEAAKEASLPPLPRGEVIKHADGQTRLQVDHHRLEKALRSRELEVPRRPLPALEVQRGQAFLRAFGGDDEAKTAGLIGNYFHAFDRPVAADAAYRRAADLAPEEPRWPHYRGDLAERQGDVIAARGHFEEAARRAPEHPLPHLRLARLARDQGDRERLLEGLNALLNRNPSSAFGLTERGIARFEVGQTEAARRDLEQALALAPDLRRIRVQLARLYRHIGRTKEAQRQVEAAREGVELGLLRLDPWMARLEKETNSLLYLKARVEEFWKARKWKELLPLLTQLQTREPNPSTLARLAQNHLYLRDYEAAHHQAELLIEIDPEGTRGYEVRARIRLASGDLAGAESDIEAAMERDPSSPVARETLVRALMARKQLERARIAAQELQALRPGDAGPVLLEIETLRLLHDRSRREHNLPRTQALRLEIEAHFKRASTTFAPQPGFTRIRDWLAEN